MSIVGRRPVSQVGARWEPATSDDRPT